MDMGSNWRIVPFAIIWSMWKGRNSRSFFFGCRHYSGKPFDCRWAAIRKEFKDIFMCMSCGVARETSYEILEGKCLQWFLCQWVSKIQKKWRYLATLEALRIFSSSFQGKLLVESDSTKAISWVSSSFPKP